MSSSSSVAARAPLGVGNGSSGSGRSSRSLHEPSSFTAEELAFARRVRTPWWQSCSPLIITLLFSVALILAGAASGQTPTVQRMLDENENQAIAEAEARVLERGADYVLPAQWQQPNAFTPAESVGPGAALGCEASAAGSPC